MENLWFCVEDNSWEQGFFCRILRRDGDKAVLQALETHVDDKGFYATTGEVWEDWEDEIEGVFKKFDNGLEYIDIDGSMAFPYDRPHKADYEHGSCESLDIEMTSPYDPGDYWTPPCGPEYDFSCRACSGKCCDCGSIEECPKGPLHYLRVGMNDEDWDEVAARRCY